MRHLNCFAVLLVLFFVGCRDTSEEISDVSPLTAAQARQALTELLDAPPDKRVEDHDWLVSLRPALDDPQTFEEPGGGLFPNAWNVHLSDRRFCPLIMRKRFRVTWSGEFHRRVDGTWEAKVVSVNWVETRRYDD